MHAIEFVIHTIPVPHGNKTERSLLWLDDVIDQREDLVSNDWI
jgi:hypothetical protein